jgi:biopolymer transport protein ExbD
VQTKRFHKANVRRAERAASSLGHGSINLVPLVDILTSIVFFSLLTYEGAALAALTAFELTLPPVVIKAQDLTQKSESQLLNLLLAVRVSPDKMIIEHTGAGSQGFRREIVGLAPPSLDTLQSVMTDIKAQFPQNDDALVIPSDDVNYDDLIHVLERIKMARFGSVALGTRARATPVTTGQPAPPAPPAPGA